MAGQPPERCTQITLSVTSDQMKNIILCSLKKTLLENRPGLRSIKTRHRLSQPANRTSINTRTGSRRSVTMLHNLCQSMLTETFKSRKREKMTALASCQDYSGHRLTSKGTETMKIWKEMKECFRSLTRLLNSGSKQLSSLESAFPASNYSKPS